jgi:hypothetical protein
MAKIEEILSVKIKPKEKQQKLVKAVCDGKITAADFISFFKTTSDINKGNCADAMKHISAKKPEILGFYVDVLTRYVNYKLPRVKWGVQEAIGNLSKNYPEETAKAIPFILKNTVNSEENTTVIKWCAAYALSEIAKNNPKTRKELIPIFESIVKKEKNSGVRNVYIKALKLVDK